LIKKISCLFIFCLFVSFSFAKEKEKTVVTGDRMEIKKSGEKTIVKGNAKIVRSSNTVTSDKMTYYKNNSNVDASGNVVFFVNNRKKLFIIQMIQVDSYGEEDLLLNIILKILLTRCIFMQISFM
jgi:hypothetical protein